MEKSVILSLKSQSPHPTPQPASGSTKPGDSHKWAVWVCARQQPLAVLMLQHRVWWGKGSVRAWPGWEERVRAGKAAPGEEVSWGAELAGQWCSGDTVLVWCPPAPCPGHSPAPTCSPSAAQGSRLVRRCHGCRFDVAAVTVPSCWGWQPTISPPHYFWLSVLPWLEGPGFVKDVSSHIVKQISNWPEGYFL